TTRIPFEQPFLCRCYPFYQTPFDFYLSSFDHVFFPAIPSAANPFARWNDLTAFSVFAPKMPSMPFGSCPFTYSDACKIHVRLPRAPLRTLTLAAFVFGPNMPSTTSPRLNCLLSSV